MFVDTPGFQTDHRNALNDRLNLNVTEAMNGVDAIAFVLEAMRFTDADRTVLKQLPKNTPVVLVVNKIDKDKAKDKLALNAFIEQVRAEFEFVAVEVVSAKHGLRIANLLETLKPFLPESVPMYPEDMVTDKPIVIGRGGEKLKKISTEARLDMEKLFDCKVFLKVWVKVKSGWADDIRFLNELGL